MEDSVWVSQVGRADIEGEAGSAASRAINDAAGLRTIIEALEKERAGIDEKIKTLREASRIVEQCN
jgi:hypothetical protein